MSNALRGKSEALTILRLLVNRLEHCEITTTTQEFEEIEELMAEAKSLWEADDADV